MDLKNILAILNKIIGVERKKPASSWVLDEAGLYMWDMWRQYYSSGRSPALSMRLASLLFLFSQAYLMLALTNLWRELG